MIQTVLLIVLVCVALALIGLVLIQQGKGADTGASFGGGASQTVFGSAGSGNFLTKSTWTLGIVFFVVCLGLGYIARQQAENAGRIDFGEAPAKVEQQAPASSGDVPELSSADKKAPASDVPAAAGDAKTETQPVPATDVPAAGTGADQADGGAQQ